MMSGNPNWWGTMNNTMHLQSQHQLSPQFGYVCNSPLSSPNQLTSPADHHLHSNGEDFPVRSWSQLLLGGLGHNEEERFGDGIFQQHRKMENWEEQVMLNLNNDPSGLKRAEVCRPDSQIYGGFGPEIDANSLPNFWPDTARRHQVVPPSSPASCVTTLSGHVLNFSGGAKLKTQAHGRDPSPHECNSTGDGGPSKKVRLSLPSAQQPLKVRKEKLGDKISALHQLVSPFGKTDTASVLSEAIGYIRFLHEQIETLSSPYMRNASAEGTRQQADYVQEKNCFLPTEPNLGSEGRHEVDDLRSMGLCLVPIECTQHVGSESGADYWAQAGFGGEF